MGCEYALCSYSKGCADDGKSGLRVIAQRTGRPPLTAPLSGLVLVGSKVLTYYADSNQ